MYHELAFEYPIQLTGNDFLAPGILKPVAYSSYIQFVAERHLHILKLDSFSMSSQHLAWVLVGTTIEIQAPVLEGTTLIGKTWHAQTKGPYFRREFTFHDENGTLVFCGATFSVVMDLNTRHILKHYTLPGNFGNGNSIFALDNVRPVFRSKAEYTIWGTRSVYNSHIDLLGHVNNTRYCEFAFDALSPGEAQCPLRRIAINFTGELRLGETFTIETGLLDETRYVRGIRNRDGKKSFDVAFTFSHRKP